MGEKAAADLVRTNDRPNPEYVRGKCPKCGEPLVSSCYYIEDRGYLIVWECWGSLRDEPSCAYRRVL